MMFIIISVNTLRRCNLDLLGYIYNSMNVWIAYFETFKIYIVYILYDTEYNVIFDF